MTRLRASRGGPLSSEGPSRAPAPRGCLGGALADVRGAREEARGRGEPSREHLSLPLKCCVGTFPRTSRGVPAHSARTGIRQPFAGVSKITLTRRASLVFLLGFAAACGQPSARSPAPDLVPDAVVGARVAEILKVESDVSDLTGGAIELPRGQPYRGPLATGECVFRVRITYSTGETIQSKAPCGFDVAGKHSRLVCHTVVLEGEIQNGMVHLTGKQRRAEFILKGEATGPDRLAGVVVGGGIASEGLRVRSGRWEILLHGKD